MLNVIRLRRQKNRQIEKAKFLVGISIVVSSASISMLLFKLWIILVIDNRLLLSSFSIASEFSWGQGTLFMAVFQYSIMDGVFFYAYSWIIGYYLIVVT